VKHETAAAIVVRNPLGNDEHALETRGADHS
jgi:hypothetical protein